MNNKAAEPTAVKENLMTMKELAKQVIESMPDNASLDEIMHALYVNTKFKHGEKEIREGKGVPDEKAKQRMKKWLK